MFQRNKPILYLNFGLLHLEKKESIYNGNNENEVVSIVNSTTVAALLDTKIKAFMERINNSNTTSNHVYRNRHYVQTK